MATWRKVIGAGLGYYVGGPAGALIGYFLGKIMGDGEDNPPPHSLPNKYYETLRVAPSAEIEEIKRSYRELVKQYHPDLQNRAGEERAKLLKEKMATVNEAYREIRKARKF
ncbi:MAG: DnaJ domain-containing protein [Pseudomonadota bacterium]